jgi:hypothetical protein
MIKMPKINKKTEMEERAAEEGIWEEGVFLYENKV